MDKINVIMFTDESNDSQENETTKECCKSKLNVDFFKELLNNCDYQYLPSVIKCYCDSLKKLGYAEIGIQLEIELLKIYQRNNGMTTREVDNITEHPTFTQHYVMFKTGHDRLHEVSRRLANRLKREYNISEENVTWLPSSQTLKILRFNFDVTLDSTINKIIQ